MTRDRSPALKFLFMMVVSASLIIPLFSVFLLVYDRQNQSETARDSIAQGWGGPQVLAGPLVVIPYKADSIENTTVDGKPATRTVTTDKELFIAADTLTLKSDIAPQRRVRSIYETIVYDATIAGRARFSLPKDLSRLGIDPTRIDLAKAELRFGVSDPRGLKTNSLIRIDGQLHPTEPGNGLSATNGSGFYVPFDARSMTASALSVEFRFGVKGNSTVALAPRAGETVWTVASPWPHPSFAGGFLPERQKVSPQGFEAVYRIPNLALGTALATTDDVQPSTPSGATYKSMGRGLGPDALTQASVGLIQPVDLYSQVNRAVKYGFLFIGFTFIAFFMFDAIGGVRVSPVEYLLVGTGLILFFVLLLAFAEVIGFLFAYLLAAGAIITLLTAYSAAVLKSWHRAGLITVLLLALYAVLYVLLSLEAYSLLIGSLLLFAALAAVMYLTRHLDWGGQTATSGPQPSDGNQNG